MIVLADREISNSHGTGVLLKNIVDAIGEKENIVLCNHIKSKPDHTIPHYCFKDIKISEIKGYRGAYYIRRMLLTNLGSRLYLLFKRPELFKIPVHEHNTIFITVNLDDVLWNTLQFIRLFPDKKYILYMMDSFIDFSPGQYGSLNRKAFKVIGEKVKKRLAISNKLANYLEEITENKYDIFYGPRVMDWDKINLFHNYKKENKICLVGNAWVESVLPVIDEQLHSNNLTITWFTNESKFKELCHKYSLTRFTFGGNLLSEEVAEKISTFRYGLILYGLDTNDDDYYIKRLQEFSIPSKILDYCIAGVETLYYGPVNTACYEFLSQNKLGALISKNQARDFFENFHSYASKPINYEAISRLLLNSNTEQFKKAIGN